MKDGELKIVNQDGYISISKLINGVSYFREKGVKYNVVSKNNFTYSFIKKEIK